MNDKPEPVSFSRAEAELVYPWHARYALNRVLKDWRVHAVLFSDGSRFDACNGWVPDKLDKSQVETYRQVAEDNFTAWKYIHDKS